MNPCLVRRCFAFVSPLALVSGGLAQEPEPVPARGVQDNSFLVEEAYNQEAGVVQHIFTANWGVDNQPGSDDREWELAFTQEWPFFSQTHQVSYSIPYLFVDSGGNREEGLGDITLNYRYQLLMETDDQPAFAPAVGVILPTGNENRGLGTDSVGLEFALPLSKVISRRWSLHANAGLTWYPDWDDRSPLSPFLAGSAIYALNSRFHLMLETVGEWAEEVDSGNIDREFSAVLAPGARYAFNLDDAQLVVGASAPIGLNGDAPDYGVFLYLSFEHRFSR